MDISLVSSLVTSGVLSFVLLYKSFFTEKGKNLATKQDIGEITDKIEGVKTFYTKEIEQLKSDLQASVFHKNKLTELSIATLLSYHSNIILLLLENLKENYGDYPVSELEKSISIHQSRTLNLFQECILQYHKLSIFISDNQELNQISIQITSSLRELKNIYRKHTAYIRFAHLSEEHSSKNSDPYFYEEAIRHTQKVYEDYYNPIRRTRNYLFFRQHKSFLQTVGDNFY